MTIHQEIVQTHNGSDTASSRNKRLSLPNVSALDRRIRALHPPRSKRFVENHEALVHEFGEEVRVGRVIREWAMRFPLVVWACKARGEL